MVERTMRTVILYIARGGIDFWQAPSWGLKGQKSIMRTV